MKLFSSTLSSAIMALSLTFSPGLTAAADRALLIGIGDYQHFDVDLPGIGQDLRMMQEVAEILGFAPAQVRTLSDAEATVQAVREELSGWLVEGVNVEDRVLIYFSGHGSRVWDDDGDERDDGADEVLLMSDAREVKRAGRGSLDGVLRDDEFADLLRAIPSHRVLVIIDACHAGSATKAIPGFDAPAYPSKFFTYADMPGNSAPALLFEDPAGNYVAVSATGDNEEALPTPTGSLFTRGIHEAVSQGRAQTPRQLAEQAQLYIDAHRGRAPRFQPRVSGNPNLADMPLGPG